MTVISLAKLILRSVKHFAGILEQAIMIAEGKDPQIAQDDKCK